MYEWHSGASSDRAPGEHGFARKQEHVTRNLHYSCAVFNAAGNTCVAASDDGKVREIVDGTTSREVELPPGVKPTSLLLLAGDKVLLVGTNNGQLLCFNWSADAPVSAEHQTYSLGQGALSSMVSDAYVSHALPHYVFVTSCTGTGKWCLRRWIMASRLRLNCILRATRRRVAQKRWNRVSTLTSFW